MRRRITAATTLLAVVVVVGGVLLTSALAAPTTLTATLAGGGDGQDADGTGSASVVFDPESETVCFELDWTKIRGPFAAHIHVGEADMSGDIVVHFFDMKNGTSLDRQIKGVSGCAKHVDAAVIDAILADPAGYYVNVHNKPYPGGAIRGQLG